MPEDLRLLAARIQNLGLAGHLPRLAKITMDLNGPERSGAYALSLLDEIWSNLCASHSEPEANDFLGNLLFLYFAQQLFSVEDNVKASLRTKLAEIFKEDGA